MSESFSTVPLQNQLKSYAYVEYQDDENIVAFFDAYNSYAQGYLDWFNNTPLSVYTSPYISGSLLDWVGQGIYGISRPIASVFSSQVIAGYDSAAYDTIAYNAMSYSSSGSSAIVDDDIYKRFMTWHLYRGDGYVFNIPWLKNRIARFLNGVNGTDVSVLDNQPSVSVASGVFTITIEQNSVSQVFEQLLADGAFSLPFQYSFNVVWSS